MNSNRSAVFYEFDDFRLDVTERCVWHREGVVPMTAKAFDTLLVLVENRGKVVEKEAILDEVWANTFVEESTLAQNISTIRKAFVSKGIDFPIIETVPRRGYRFLREVRHVIEEDDLYVVETRTSTRVLAEQTDIHESDGTKLASRVATSSRRSLGWVAVGAAVLLVTVIGIGLLLTRSTFFSAAAPQFLRTKVQTVASNGNVQSVALSPDAKYIATIEQKDDLSSIHLKMLAGSTDVEVVAPSKDEYAGVAFDAAGQSIYYSVYSAEANKDPANKIGVLYKVPVLGGPKVEIARDIDSPAAISADGNKIAFIRYARAQDRSDLVVLERMNGAFNERIASSRKFDERFSTSGVSWSPDGTRIAAVAASPQNPARANDLLMIDARTGEQTSVTDEPFDWAGQTMWLDNDSILFVAYRDSSSDITDEILIASIADGKVRRIRDGLNGLAGFGYSSSTGSMAAVKLNRVTSLLVTSGDSKGDATVIKKSVGDNSLYAMGIDWTPDDKILYAAAVNSNADIWSIDPDGANSRQITAGERADFIPVVSPDGTKVSYLSNQSGSLALWVMSRDGSDQRQLIQTSNLTPPSFSADSQWIYFSGNSDPMGPQPMWRVSVSGGTPERLTEKGCVGPQVSPDGKYVFCHFPTRQEDGTLVRPLLPSVVSIDGKTVIKQFKYPGFKIDGPIYWYPDGSGFTFTHVENGVANIWIQRITEDKPQKLTNFQTDLIFRYRWSRDGRYLAFEKGFRVSDVVLITEE